MFSFVILISALFVTGCQAQCMGTTCGECISFGYSCSWCSQANFGASRCQSITNLEVAKCEEKNIENPTSSLTNTMNQEVRDSNAQNDNAVQIQPQKVRIVTRIREEHKFSMTFRAANNFPVDLYFLFDNSFTMESQIKNLAKLASNIGQSISSISTNYMMGYGIFQDKVILPFTETVKEKLENPCFVKGLAGETKCAAPFEFKHILNMTKNINEFKQKVDQTNVTGNIDHPEGSIDAILQAITCKSEIGWRDRARKLLIFASNDRFHLAGDGRLAGIVIPNDGHCHLDGAGKYAKELEQDYPSVSQLADLVERNEVHIIFAVTNDQIPLFKILSKRIPQSTVEHLASPNDTNSRDIREIIEKKYREMVSEVEIVHSKIKGVDLQIRATSEICERRGTNKCKGLQIGTPIKFDVEVKVTECPSSPEEKVKEVLIYPDSMRHEMMVLEIETNCDCGCTSNSFSWEVNSSICTAGNGTLKCGLCECNSDRFGQFCECDATDLDSSNSGCIRPGINSTVQCSSAGKCECGVCKCDEGYSGSYCECNDRACASFGREVCGGARGRCVCGECACEPEYTGNACECSISNETCIFDEKVCNNAGTCECGECKCTMKGYVGQYCENCFLCGDTACDILSYRRCAECAILNSKGDNCPEDCPEIQLVTSLENADGSGFCSIKQADGCFLSFRISMADTNVTIIVQKTTICPEPLNLVPIVGGVVGGVVAIGLLLLLLWKILTSVFDRIEYSKFEEDLKQCKWAQQDNPFYKGATTTYKNPMLDTTELK